MLWLVLLPLAVACCLALACSFPRYTAEDAAGSLAQLDAVLLRGVAFVADSEAPSDGDTGPSVHLPVLSFNLRHDVDKGARSFTARLPRIVRLFDRVQPWIAGVQEPWSSQLSQLMGALPPRYRSLADPRAEVHERRTDGSFVPSPNIALLYDAERLELLEHDFLYLSKTPRVAGSSNWGSSRARAVNVARLRMRPNDAAGLSASTAASLEVLAFNTHLDVRAEAARRGQAAVLARIIAEWQARFPHAVTILTGDFNTAPGQAAHAILTHTMTDAWTACAKATTAAALGDGFCAQAPNALSHSFHGWLGTRLHSAMGRLALGVGFTLYSAGLHTPIQVPSSLRQWLSAAVNLLSRAPQYSFAEAAPAWPWNRFHVDWILFAQPSSGALQLTPLFVDLLDGRNESFSSDHFPLVGVFLLRTPGTPNSTDNEQALPAL